MESIQQFQNECPEIMLYYIIYLYRKIHFSTVIQQRFMANRLSTVTWTCGSAAAVKTWPCFCTSSI